LEERVVSRFFVLLEEHLSLFTGGECFPRRNESGRYVVEAHSSSGELPEKEKWIYAFAIEFLDFGFAISDVERKYGVIKSNLIISDNVSIICEEVITKFLCLVATYIMILE